MLLTVRPTGFALISQSSQKTMVLIKQNWNHEKRMVKILTAKKENITLRPFPI